MQNVNERYYNDVRDGDNTTAVVARGVGVLWWEAGNDRDKITGSIKVASYRDNEKHA
jgi:hypothetical protein